MKSVALLCVLVLSLAGCEGADDGARAALKAGLKDPDSAKFEESITYKDFKCLKYNAKNGYGAYAGASWAILEKRSYGWTVLKPGESACFESTLKDIAHPELVEQKSEATRQIMAAMHAGKLAPESAQDVYQVPPGPCWRMATEMKANSSLAIEAEDAAVKTAYGKKFDEQLALAARGVCAPESGPKA